MGSSLDMEAGRRVEVPKTRCMGLNPERLLYRFRTATHSSPRTSYFLSRQGLVLVHSDLELAVLPWRTGVSRHHGYALVPCHFLELAFELESWVHNENFGLTKDSGPAFDECCPRVFCGLAILVAEVPDLLVTRSPADGIAPPLCLLRDEISRLD